MTFWQCGYSRLAILMVLILLGICSSASGVALSDYYCSFEVVGYYPDYWQIPIPDLQYDLLTGIVFFSIYPNADGSLNTSEIDLARQSALVTAAHGEQVDVSICIGGWGLSDNFSAAAGDPTVRGAFVNHLVTYCLEHDFDGVVLDWEPVSTVTDQSNYTLLIQELKAALSVHGKMLSVAVMALGGEFFTSAIPSIDRLHIMAYDMGTPHSTYEMATTAISHWETFGFERSKIILGLPFYGRDANFSYDPYDELIAAYRPGPEVDAVNGIYFNGIDTIQRKTRYMAENEYRGVMIWELTEDTRDATSLLTAISDTVHLSQPPDFNCDGAIDLADLYHLANHWLTEVCSNSNAWCQSADADHSGRVSLTDFVSFTSYWMGQ
jgi:hypothetical protein